MIDRTRLLAGSVPAAARERRGLALDLLDAALARVEPHAATRRGLEAARAAGIDLDGCTLLAFGKAARGMAEAALAEVRVARGIVLGFHEGRLGPLVMHRAGHPLPCPDAPAHGSEVLSLARSLGAGDVALCLVSGGGSAMLELPRQGVALASVAETTRLMNEAGASIAELNAVRRALSQLKGGRLAAALAPARVVNVLISDVPAGDLSVIASGPSVPPAPGAPDARAVIERYGLRGSLPADALGALDAPEPVESVPAQSFLAADNADARRAVVARASELGVRCAEHPRELSGIAREAGPRLYESALSRFAAEPALHAVIAGGETTVEVHGSGRGGRNQELALAVLAAYQSGLVATLGTDGIDGSSDATGALVDEAAAGEAQRLGLDPARFLADNDSHAIFADLGTQLRTGPTGTNVADLCLILR